jgi:hypothetical protein
MDGKESLNKMEKMIEEVFVLEDKESLDITYLGKLIDNYKIWGGDASKYQKRYMELLN